MKSWRLSESSLKKTLALEAIECIQCSNVCLQRAGACLSVCSRSVFDSVAYLIRVQQDFFFCCTEIWVRSPLHLCCVPFLFRSAPFRARSEAGAKSSCCVELIRTPCCWHVALGGGGCLFCYNLDWLNTSVFPPFLKKCVFLSKCFFLFCFVFC